MSLLDLMGSSPVQYPGSSSPSSSELYYSASSPLSYRTWVQTGGLWACMHVTPFVYFFSGVGRHAQAHLHPKQRCFHSQRVWCKAGTAFLLVRFFSVFWIRPVGSRGVQVPDGLFGLGWTGLVSTGEIWAGLLTISLRIPITWCSGLGAEGCPSLGYGVLI
ncbi:uncharacterized protein B0T15DRAFT_8969 [Chaetomium strumarium]|uniref:Uncharacterized protein n=1 Tax=Chaetomium strumarium TaxID=1170767 RepID=A0AAJ0H0L2_9PEZI|nr:hypothetical protein B0T15DRAFT_8969 [Chaetomium strumarium]